MLVIVGELSLQDRIEDALDPSFTNVEDIRGLLREVEATGLTHPVVVALQNKEAALGGGAE